MERGDFSTGKIKFIVDNVSSIPVIGKYSHEIEVEGMQWKVCAYKSQQDKKLYAYLNYTKSDSNLWSFNVSGELKLIGKQTEIVRKVERTFNHQCTSTGRFMISWEDLMDETKGYIQDDKITIEAKFTLKNVMGIRTIPRVDFSDKDEPRHDMALEIEGENVYVSKQYLSLHSPVFDAMFFGNFAEKRKKIVELKDIKREEFTELLRVIYPSQEKITDNNYAYLLSLGDRFQMKMVLDKVEQHIISSTKLTIPEKLKFSDDFRLVKLHDFCLDSFNTVQEITKIKNTDGYKSLSDKAKVALMEKVMKLSQ